MSTCRFLVVALVITLWGCDPYYRVIVSAPLVRPLADSCAQQVFQTLTAIPPFHVAPHSAGTKSDTTALLTYLGALSSVQQVRHKDSTALLEASVGRMWYRFDRDEMERIGNALGPTLLRVRDECGGVALTSIPYKVRRSPF